jgi:hypothetical protein
MVLALTISISSVAGAQDTPTGHENRAKTGKVIVTAQRRWQSLIK